MTQLKHGLSWILVLHTHKIIPEHRLSWVVAGSDHAVNAAVKMNAQCAYSMRNSYIEEDINDNQYFFSCSVTSK